MDCFQGCQWFKGRGWKHASLEVDKRSQRAHDAAKTVVEWIGNANDGFLEKYVLIKKCLFWLYPPSQKGTLFQ
jgi:hypothetical protein